MAGSMRTVLVAAALLAGNGLAGNGTAHAYGGGCWGGRPTYYSGPVYGPAYGSVYHVPRPMPAPCDFAPAPYPPPPPKPRSVEPPPRPLVKPIPKEAKQTAEPPKTGSTGKRAPIVTESRSLGGAFPESAPRLPQGVARVGFWNVTGRDITLTIDGRQRSLPKDRAVTVDLERSFTWQANDGALQTERVPEDQRTFEVIIRP